MSSGRREDLAPPGTPGSGRPTPSGALGVRTRPPRADVETGSMDAQAAGPVEVNRRLVWLIGIRLLVAVSIAVPYFLYRPAVDGPAIRVGTLSAEEGDERVAAVEKALESGNPERAASLLELALDSSPGDPRLAELWERIHGEPPEEDAASLVHREQRQRLRAVRLLMAVVSVETLLYLALLRLLWRRARLHAYLQFAGDLLLITILIYELGPAASNFSILYVFVISVASIFLRRSGTLVIATLAYLLYETVVLAPGLLDVVFRPLRLLTQSGVDLPQSVRAAMSTEGLIYNLIIHFLGFYGVAFLTTYLSRDVAEVEERLRRKQRDLSYLQVFHRDVIESISSGLVATDVEGVVTSCNRAGQEMLAPGGEELVGRHVSEVGLMDADRWGEETWAAREGKRLRTEVRLERDGLAMLIGLTVNPLRDGDGRHRGYILIFQDLTEWRELQEQLRLKDRMAAMGEMAAGLAHEVGNPLAAISGSVQMLAGSFRGGPAQRKLLDITLRESRRLDRTVKDFLQMSQPREHGRRRFDVAALLAEDVELLRMSEEVREVHSLRIELDPPSATIEADPDQLGQIFWNLARNALAAMPQGGELVVSGLLMDDVYRIEFRDDGAGMNDDEKADLFHPFKTFFDGGTGLGMAIVYRIVEEHHGHIRVESEPGRGTTVTVDLPIERSDALAANDPEESETGRMTESVGR